VLRQKAHQVERFEDTLSELAQDMAETMHAENGVGLAAPQVGVLERVIIVHTPEDEEEPGSGQMYVLVNPEVSRASDELAEGLEGCLSIPGYVGEVARHASVTIKGQDLKGNKIRVKARGFLARAFQHEIDHLDGVLFIDKLTAPDRIWKVEEGQEEQSEMLDDPSELQVTESPRPPRI
jgi:peptide deformylase